MLSFFKKKIMMFQVFNTQSGVYLGQLLKCKTLVTGHLISALHLDLSSTSYFYPALLKQEHTLYQSLPILRIHSNMRTVT